MPKSTSNRNGGRPALPPEQRTQRKTLTMPPRYWEYLATLDSNRSAAVRKLIDAAAPPAAPKRAKETK